MAPSMQRGRCAVTAFRSQKSEHLNARTNMNVMLRDKLTVIWRMTHPLAAEDRAAWDSLIPAFTEELPHPERVELVITDQYRAVAGEYAAVTDAGESRHDGC